MGMAVDTLWKLVSSKEIHGSMESVMGEIVTTISSLIPVCTSEYFFDFLEKAVRKHLHAMRHQAVELMRNITQRVHAEYREIQRASSIRSTLLISKCLVCALEIVRDSDLLEEYYSYFYQDILSLVLYLDRTRNDKTLCNRTNLSLCLSIAIINFEDSLCDLAVVLIQVITCGGGRGGRPTFFR